MELKSHYRFRNSPPLGPTLSQINPVQAIPQHFNIILPLRLDYEEFYLFQIFKPKPCTNFTFLSHTSPAPPISNISI
jgi:hypothetical protein